MEDGRPNPGKGEIFAQVAQSGGAAPHSQTTREEERRPEEGVTLFIREF